MAPAHSLERIRMKLKAGTRVKSAVCTTEVMVIQAPDADVELRCGGAPMLAIGEPSASGGSVAAGASAGTQIGKRYVNADANLELLCTKPGNGSLAVGDSLLLLKEAKPLPASD
jgi:hypothetical protein